MQDNLRQTFTGLAGILFVALLAYTITHHELWGDEIHSWNIVKASSSLAALFHNMRYEGHPPLWYLLLYPLTRLTHDPRAMQPLQFVIACAAMGLLLFRSPLPLFARLLAPFGYFLLYEYGAFSRNYAIGVLLAFCICIVLARAAPMLPAAQRGADEPALPGRQAGGSTPTERGAGARPRFRVWLYYLLLLLLSNTHLLGLLLAFSFHAWFLLSPRKTSRRKLSLHLLGFVVLLPAVFFILPPGDSQMNAGFWLHHWDLHRLTPSLQAPLRAFLPMPAWWEDHWWNTECLLGWKSLALFGALAGPVLGWMGLTPRGRVLFAINFIVTLLAGLVFPLTSARYTGFLLIGWFAAAWVGTARDGGGRSDADTRGGVGAPARPRRWPALLLLALQIPAAVFAVWQDGHRPFSRADTAPQLVGEVPVGARLVCDYWALNPLAAFTDSAFYCIDLGEKRAFLRWDGDFAARLQRPDRYVDGARRLGPGALYLISTASPPELERAAGPGFQVRLIDFRDGAIEKGSNLYLYEVDTMGSH
ncbi:hypothetical protein [Dinghuibacter silviterrae]|uniref:Dolichyl-phosphate-mannose-protein mannosyltransferase n=1 Tax=Dinghuibacter silviterrae TaxID=1539049 RepID=A0A4R8DHL4_9BACT|nr:hypothetical protein [Dinghuibacter silviterrae]TDW96606.1 hypothetical protein EDB95_4439 [Dinghuibacter silviterrae]